MRRMTQPVATSYDDIPYAGSAYATTHPRILEAVGTLFGMQPPGLADCRVLELGCGAGDNLIPMAQEFPDAAFLGIDLSSRQIEDGRGVVSDLGLTNTELRADDIMAVDDTWGRFDYVICHGVYSWVPAKVQERILEICCRNLEPNGVAVVSYNTYPGWHFREIVRDMMRYHVGQFSDAHEQVAQARAALDFLVEACDADSPYGRLLRDELVNVRKTDESYIYHEHLETFNQPVYFHEFAVRLARHNLQYLAESKVSRMLTGDLPEATQQILNRTPLVRREQYLDFLRNTAFRSTLICHKGIDVKHELTDASLERFHVQLSAKTGPLDADFRGAGQVTFDLKGSKLTVAMPLIKAALVYLGRTWPVAVSVPELYAQSLAMLGRSQEDDNSDMPLEALHYLLRLALGADALEFYVHPPRCVSAAGERPRATSLARYQASRRELVATAWHRTVKPDVLGRFILERADGTREVETLKEEVAQALRDGQLTFAGDDAPREVDAVELDRMVTVTLEVLAEAALLAE